MRNLDSFNDNSGLGIEQWLVYFVLNRLDDLSPLSEDRKSGASSRLAGLGPQEAVTLKDYYYVHFD